MADYQFDDYQGPEEDFGLADVPDAAPQMAPCQQRESRYGAAYQLAPARERLAAGPHAPQQRAVHDYNCGGDDHPYCEGFSGQKRAAVKRAQCGQGDNPHDCDEKEGMYSDGGGGWLNRKFSLKTIIIVLIVVYFVMVACEMRAELRDLKMGRRGSEASS